MEEEVKKQEIGKTKAKSKNAKKILLIVLCVLLSLVILFVGTLFILRYVGFRNFHKNDSHIKNENVEINDEDYITYKGERYKLNENIISVLVLGIDKRDINQNEGIGKNGQADCIFLACIDTAKKTYTLIPISREAMVDVEIYSSSGIYQGIEREQICLAYAYGKTPKDCSENVLKAVKRMFYGININSYVTIDINGFSELSTLVGGITLTSLETLSEGRYNFYEGQEVTLIGQNAVNYIQMRGTDIEANNRRMLRQRQFLSALLSRTGNIVMDDFTKLADYYYAMQPYTSTNIDLPKLTYFASSCLTRDIGSKIVYRTVEGSMTETKYSEFNINEESLLDLIIDVFYEKAK